MNLFKDIDFLMAKIKNINKEYMRYTNPLQENVITQNINLGNNSWLEVNVKELCISFGTLALLHK